MALISDLQKTIVLLTNKLEAYERRDEEKLKEKQMASQDANQDVNLTRINQAINQSMVQSSSSSASSSFSVNFGDAVSLDRSGVYLNQGQSYANALVSAGGPLFQTYSPASTMN